MHQRPLTLIHLVVKRMKRLLIVLCLLVLGGCTCDRCNESYCKDMLNKRTDWVALMGKYNSTTGFGRDLARLRAHDLMSDIEALNDEIERCGCEAAK